MHPFIFYLVRSAVIAGIFYAYYCLLLRNKKLHTYNRVYILSSILLSLVIPLLHFEWGRAVPPAGNAAIKMLQVISRGSYEQDAPSGPASLITISGTLWGIYIAVAVLMLGTTAYRIYQLYTIKRTSQLSQSGNITIVHTRLEQAPFSFLSILFWNDNTDINSPDGQCIARHELVHIQQRHTIDKLFTRAVLAFFWMNPFFWLFQKELSLVHEFLADEGSIDGQDTATFAQMLLRSHFGNRFPGIIQPFFYSPVKRRLLMLQKTNKPGHARLRKLLVLPLLPATVLLFSFSAHEKSRERALHKATIIIDAGHGGQDNGANGINGMKEKDLTLRVSRELARLAPEYNINVIPTRTDDDYPTLADRVKVSEGTNADLFVSVHVNKDEPGKQHTGYEVNVCSSNPQYGQSKLLASAIIAQLGRVPVQASLIERPRLVVLRQNTLPSVLIECGNMDNEQDIAMLQDDKQLEQVCRDMLAGIVVYENGRGKK